MKSVYLLVVLSLCALSSIASAENVHQKSTAQAKDNWSTRKWVLTPSIGRSSFGESGDIRTNRNFADRIGTTLELSASTPVADRLWASIGIDFLPTGADTTSKTSGDRTSIERDYVGFPIVAKFDVLPFQEARSAFYLKAGLTPAFVVSATTVYSDGRNESLGDSSNVVVLGNLGFGTRLALNNKTSLDASLTYMHSLTNPVQSTTESFSLDGILLTAGVGFGI